VQEVEEITKTKEEIIKEVEVAKESSQKILWHGRVGNKHEWFGMSHT
jgi:hypothetical protein